MPILSEGGGRATLFCPLSRFGNNMSTDIRAGGEGGRGRSVLGYFEGMMGLVDGVCGMGSKPLIWKHPSTP